MANGISKAGEAAKRRFCNLTGASPVPGQESAAILDNYTIQIRGITKPTSGTANQIRAVKYRVIAIFNQPKNDWYVISPDDVARLLNARVAGQHGKNPYENSTLNLGELARYLVPPKITLADACLKAAKKGDRYPAIRSALEDVVTISELAAQQAHDVVDQVI